MSAIISWVHNSTDIALAGFYFFLFWGFAIGAALTLVCGIIELVKMLNRKVHRTKRRRPVRYK